MISKLLYVQNRDSIVRGDNDTLIRFNLYINGSLLITDGWDAWDGSDKSYSIEEAITNLFVVRSVWLIAGESDIIEDEFIVIAVPTNINLLDI